MVHRLLLTMLLLGFAGSVCPGAQPTEAERKQFKDAKAKADHGDAEAQLTVGGYYAAGTGIGRDLGKAVKYHRKAAEQGLAKAQYQLGMDYATGEGIEEDKTEAIVWFRKAAEQGFADAQVELALALLDGAGTKMNSTEAVRWLRKAVAQSSVEAEYHLGKCYLEGTGVTRDISEGVKWVRHAADRGYAPAQNMVGTAYTRGIVVQKDYVQAYKWFALAAAQDDAHADEIKVSMAKAESFLTKEQVAEAQRLATEFVPTNAPIAGAATIAAPAQTNIVAASASDPAGTGIVQVTAPIDDCEVYADGEFVGNLPAKLRLKEGRHVIEVKKEGLKTYRKEIKVTAGSDVTLKAVMGQ